MNQQQPPGSNNSGNERVPRIPQDRYELLGVLGSGGMGTVLKARHAQLNKLVAIKVLNIELVRDKSSLSRFEIEAKAGGQLSHPNLVAVFDFGYTVDGEPFFVMEYVEGSSLGELVKKYGRCSNEDFIHIFGQALKALNYIHKNSVIHRDIKSSNIMLQIIDRDRYVKLLDFGIAKVLADSGVTMQQLTATGEAIGSPLYMSPEQCRGSRVDLRADIYSLGCVMHECFAGYPPFRGANAMATIHMHLNDQPAPLSGMCRSEQELQIASLIHKCILKNPDDRYQSASELLDNLEEIKNVGTQVKQIQRPAPGASAGMGNRWKKGGSKQTGAHAQYNPPGPEGPQRTSGLHQALKPSGIMSSGLHQAIKPGPKADAENQEMPAGGGLGQTFRRSPYETQVGNMTNTVMSAQNPDQHGGTQVSNVGAVNQAPQGANVDFGLTPDEATERWHMHNMIGQQKMASRSHFEAESHFKQAIELANQYFEHSDPRIPKTINNFANCLKVQGRYNEAEQAYLQALQTKENAVGPTHKDLILFLENYASLLRICKREQEAAKYDKRINAIMNTPG